MVETNLVWGIEPAYVPFSSRDPVDTTNDIPVLVLSGIPASDEEHPNDEQSVASRIPCGVRGRTSVVNPVTEVVLLPRVWPTVNDPS